MVFVCVSVFPMLVVYNLPEHLLTAEYNFVFGPNSWIIRPPAWIFLPDLHHYAVYLHIPVMLNERGMVVSNERNTNYKVFACLLHSMHPGETVALADNER